jgi:hypothetical protein
MQDEREALETDGPGERLEPPGIAGEIRAG